MINFHPNVRNRLNRKQGQQAVLLLEIDWLVGGTVTYSDTDFPGARPYLVSASRVTRSSQGRTTNNQIQIVLDSTNAEVESSFRSIDVHLRPARLYLGFPGVLEKALLFEGLVNSQIVWDDTARTLQFDILSKVEESLVGFSMEDGFFPKIAPEDRGKVWPLPFGTVCHYQTQRLTTTIKGFLVEGQGVVDPTLAPRICQIEKTQCPTVEIPFGSNIPGIGFSADRRPDPNCLARKRNEGCILKDLLTRQSATAKSVIQVRGGNEFPQNRPIKVLVGGVRYRGVMNGENFTITSIIHPDQDKVSPCRTVAPQSVGYRYGIGSEDEANKCTNHGANGGVANPLDCWAATGPSGNYVSICGFDPQGTTLQQGVVGGAADSWKYYDSMATGRYIFLPAGTEVVLSEYDDDLVYMASLVPGTVTQVAAYRTFGDTQLLTQVPTDWYSVVNVDYGGYQCVELRFNRLPSTAEEEGWSDDIYVSFVSSVGPNPVAIIQWLVENYTDYSVDSSNFAAMTTKMANFPSHFVLTDRPNALDLISDIAYQSRMAVRVVDNTVSLVYLAEDPTSVRTFTGADIVSKSFSVGYSATEDLRTNHNITWRDQYAPQIGGEDVEQQFSIRFNIPKYGSSQNDVDWYTQTTFETIYKAATFWLIRQSNTWLEVEFQTTIEHLDLDVYDCVTLNLAPQFPANTKIVLLEKSYDPESNLITWKAWTPIRAGEVSPYYWAWPATVASGIFPLPGEDTNIGDGSGKVVIPPVNHPLRLGYVEGESIPVSSGDPFPSDVGFVAPSVNCVLPIGNEIKFSATPVIDALAKQQFQEDVNQKQSANNSGDNAPNLNREKRPCSTAGINPCPPENLQAGDENPNPPTPEEGEQSPCRYLVQLNWVIPTSIRSCDPSGNPVGPCNKQTGFLCNWQQPPIVVEYVMTSFEAAQAAVTAHNALRDSLRCGAKIGVAQPGVGTTIRTFTGEGVQYINVAPPDAECPTLQADVPEGPIFEGDSSDPDFVPPEDPSNPTVGE